MKKLHIYCIAVVLWLTIPVISKASEVRVAVAANFTAPAQKIAALFQTTSGHTVILSFGSTGKFYAQIQAGAPFDVLLAADAETPHKLGVEGLADLNSGFTYAIGKLVLWSKTPHLVDNKGLVLHSQFGTLAIANPKLAPYGLAAQQTLEYLKLWDAVQQHLVIGESIAQTMQFADTGNADLAFVALSQTIKNGETIAGSLWLVPTHLYYPIHQSAIRLLTVGQDQSAVLAFLNYLKSSKALYIIKSYGYALP